MSTASRLGRRNLAIPRRSSGSLLDLKLVGPEPDVRENSVSSFVYGLKSIFGSFLAQHDFSPYYERNLHHRSFASWAHVGHSMRHALGKPVEVSVVSPDGRRLTYVVRSSASDEQHQGSFRRSREAVRDLRAGISSDPVVIQVTGKQAEVLLAETDGGSATETDGGSAT